MHIKIITLGVLIIATLFTSPIQATAQDVPEYVIHRVDEPIRVDGRLDEIAWTAAPEVGQFVFPWHEIGKKEQTVAKLLWDDTYLYAAFICEDSHISAEYTQHDSNVYMDDAVEVFTAPNPDHPESYINLEMNVLGMYLDDYNPEGPGSGDRRGWNMEGVQIKTTIVGSLNDDSDQDEYWILEAAIPLHNFSHIAKNTPPQPDDVWHMNLNRLGGNINPQFSQWSASKTSRPSFHVPEDFGRVIFSGQSSPFLND